MTIGDIRRAIEGRPDDEPVELRAIIGEDGDEYDDAAEAKLDGIEPDPGLGRLMIRVTLVEDPDDDDDDDDDD